MAGSDQVVKLETKGALSGRINDIAWDGESKRLIVVGEGRESFGRALMLEGGSSCGEIIGHSKAVNAVAIRSKRPFRAATGGDDGVISFMTGVPYKFSKARIPPNHHSAPIEEGAGPVPKAVSFREDAC